MSWCVICKRAGTLPSQVGVRGGPAGLLAPASLGLKFFSVGWFGLGSWNKNK